MDDKDLRQPSALPHVPDYATGGTGAPPPTDATKVPEWAMEAAVEIDNKYLGHLTDDCERTVIARIIAAAAPDELAIRRDEMEKCKADVNRVMAASGSLVSTIYRRIDERFAREHGGPR